MNAVLPLPPVARRYRLSPHLRRMLRRSAARMVTSAMRAFAPPERLGSLEWAEAYRYLSSEETGRPGKYSASVTPWIPGILEAVDDPTTEMAVAMKAAQVAWTSGVVCNKIGRTIHLEPSTIVAMFPKEGAAREFGDEKFTPMVKATPALSARVDLKSRKDGNRALFKRFRGGYLKMVGSNSPASVKSTAAPLLIIEEPDDASSNLRGQGDSIALLKERKKTFDRALVIYGGTPTIKGLSAVETAYEASDQRKFYVPCHECGEPQTLEWENVVIDDDPGRLDPVYGHGLPETARYACPHCGCLWTDEQRIANVARGKWVASKPFEGVAGFHIPELLAGWKDSRVVALARKYLAARHKLIAEGDEGDLIAFINSSLGRPYEFQAGQVKAEVMAEAAEDYPELEVQEGGLLLVAGVDFQHDRVAVILRAYGRGEESWLVWWGELYGNVHDRSDLVWDQLEARLFSPVRHVSGRQMHVRAASFDSSDGNTNDAVYDFVRAMRLKRPRLADHLMPVKGDSERSDGREIFSVPSKRPIDHRQPTKSARYGLRVFMVGTSKAKDLIIGSQADSGRINLKGNGPGRFHVYKGVRSDYFDQLLAEVKAPSRRHRGKLVWQKKAGRSNEVLDGEVYALHAARSLRTHVMTPAQWDAIERSLHQSDLFSDQESDRAGQVLPSERQAPDAADAVVPGGAEEAGRAPSQHESLRPRRISQSSGFGSEDWNL